MGQNFIETGKMQIRKNEIIGRMNFLRQESESLQHEIDLISEIERGLILVKEKGSQLNELWVKKEKKKPVELPVPQIMNNIIEGENNEQEHSA